MNKYSNPYYRIDKTEGNGSLVESVKAVLIQNEWSHSKNSSRVTSVRDTFNRWMKRKIKSLHEIALKKDANAVRMSQATFSVRLAAGLIALTTGELFELGEALRKFVSHPFAVAENDALELLQILNSDFAEVNNYVDLKAVQEAYDERKAQIKQDEADAKTIEEAINAMSDVTITDKKEKKEIVTV